MCITPYTHEVTFSYFNSIRKFQATVLFMVAMLFSSCVVGETSFNGFVSLFAGKVTEGNEFLADYPEVGIYDNDWSFSPDSTLGAQFSSYITDDFSLVTQIVVKGASDIDADIDWLYGNYHVSSELSVQFGRKRLPLYYYSDYFDLGYAYYWVRPPADLYTWQITNYNGISLLYEKNLGEMDATINLYYGNEESNNNDLLSLLFGVPVDECWKDMIGIVGAVSDERVDIRLSYMHGLVDRSVNGVAIITDSEQEFLGLSINLTLGQLQILSELNNYKRPDNEVNINSHMLSLAYQIGDFTPHLTRSALKQDVNTGGNDERHHTTTVGVRWDFYTNIAFKIQYDKVVDEGIIVPIKGDSNSISLGLDYVF